MLVRMVGWAAVALVILGISACSTATVGGYPRDSKAIRVRMGHYTVPSLSVAVIDDFGIAWTGSYGRLDAGNDESVTTATLFQTASIGKSVVAMAVLHQVREGVVDLDEDVATYLTGWSLPDSDFTRSQSVTLRRLLSHTAGTTVHGFDGYSGGGYLIAQQVLEDTTGEGLSHLVAEKVFEPLAMGNSRFDPLPENEWHRAASGHRPEGNPLAGQWHTYPERGAGPFWSTPSDMARFGIEVMLAFNDRSDSIVSQPLAKEMLTPVAGEYRLGFWIGDDGGDRLHATHVGGNEGYKTRIVLYPERGQGIVVMTNSDNGGPWGSRAG